MNDSELRKLLNEIGKKISEAVSNRPNDLPALAQPSADRLTFGKILGVFVSALVIFSCLWAGLNYVVSSAITSSMVQPGKDLVKQGEQIEGIRKDVDRLLDRSAKDTFRTSPETPVKDSAKQIKQAAEWAIHRNIKIDPIAIQKVAEPLLRTTDEDSWSSTIALLDLRSFVNTTPEYAKQHVIATVKGSEVSKIPFRNQDEWVEFTEARFKLDGKPGERGSLQADGRAVTAIMNLIVSNSRVEYRGGKIVLVNVFFENCKFEISNNDNGHRMAMAILDPKPYTSFTAT